MKWFIALFMLVLPVIAALNDPGAGEADRPARRTARVTAWQSAYESLSAEQLQNQSRRAVEDMYESSCLYEFARSNGATGDDAAVQEWSEDKIAVMAGHQKLNTLGLQCGPPTDWTPELGEQGGILPRRIVVGVGTAITAIKREVPVLPRVGNVPPLLWGNGPLQTCTINAVTGPCIAMSHDLHEVHRDILEAIVVAKGLEDSFALVRTLAEVNWTVTP